MQLKTLMRVFFILAFITTISFQSLLAQKNEFSLGPVLAMPNGDFHYSHGVGIGGMVRFERGVGKSLGFGLTASYISFAGKTTSFTHSRYNIFPIQLFLKYYGSSVQEGFYIMANAGIVTGSSIRASGNNSIQMGFGPEIGYHLKGVDIGLGYSFFTLSTGSPQYFKFSVAIII